MQHLEWVDRVSKAVGNALSLLFMVAVIISAYEVVMRYVFNAPTIWVHDSAITMAAIGFIFGGSYVLQRGDHIRITSVYDLLPRPARRACELLCSVLIVGYLGVLLHACLRQAIPSVAIMETNGHAWDVPIPALLKTLLALGVGLMLVQALVQLVRLLANFADGGRRQ